MILCDYECGKEGKYLLKNGKWCCSESHNSCEVRRKQVSDAHADGRITTEQLDGTRAWSKGITSLEDKRIQSSIRDNFDKYFCKHDKFINMGTIKKFLKRTNLLDYKCKICNLSPTWNGKKLILHLDHIDGNRKNNELSNIRWLCPNCHSQTSTYCKNRNYKAKKYITEDELIKTIKKSTSVAMTLRKLNLSVSGLQYEKVRNVMDKHNLEFEKKISLKVESPNSKRKINFEQCTKCKDCENLIHKESKTGLCRKCCNIHIQKVKRPDSQTLLNEVIKYPMLTVGKKYGVSDNAVRKWLKLYGLPYKSSDLRKLAKVT